MNKQETTADIIADMRGGPIPQHRRDQELLRYYADRLEAAWKREVEALTAKLDEARHCWKVWSERADELKNKCNEQYAKLKSVSNADIGNGAKLREALVEIDKNTDLLDIAEDIAPKLHPSHSFVAVQIRKIVRAALSAPPRNCDRFATADDAKKEFNYLWNFVWKYGGGVVDERWYWGEFDRWLFAPATEQEGGLK